MWSRLAFGLACATMFAWLSPGAAQAGGWAVATIDSLPEDGFQAGASYQLGYTIRQHGQTPFDGAQTSIRITSPSTGHEQKFAGRPDGRPGHYVAEVVFPSGGEWAWEVSQYPFAPQSLGTVRVVTPPSAATSSGASEWLSPTISSLPGLQPGAAVLAWLWLVLAAATLFALVLVGRWLYRARGR